jgi:hypothetical protein
MTTSLSQWARLHLVDAAAMRTHWDRNPERRFTERLLDPERFDRGGAIWSVRTELELHRILGALQFRNPEMHLWFRGEQAFHEKALPKRLRISTAEAALTGKGVAWLDKHSSIDRAIRDRSALARLAILQHYGCPTSLLDVSRNHEIACAFAFAGAVQGQAYLRVYALPRHQRAVNVLDTLDTVLVDLAAELPSFCSRPHVQQAAFVARRSAVCNDLEGASPATIDATSIDALCVAHLRLEFEGATRFYKPRRDNGVLYPRAGGGCRVCKKDADMNGDYLLHILECYAREFPEGKPSDFPDKLAES